MNELIFKVKSGELSSDFMTRPIGAEESWNELWEITTRLAQNRGDLPIGGVLPPSSKMAVRQGFFTFELTIEITTEGQKEIAVQWIFYRAGILDK